MEREQRTLFIAATHGDEGFSLDVLSNLETRCPRERFSYDWIIGNPDALAAGTRYTQADLNRSAPGNPASSVYERRRAAEIVELSARYTFAVDIHGSVSPCGVITIIPYPTLRNVFLAAAFPVKNNVIWYAKSSEKSGPIAQFTRCPGIEIECGPKSSADVKTELENVLSRFLQDGIRMSADGLIRSLANKSFYYVYDKQEEDGRQYADFIPVKTDTETYYPFLSHQYPGIACYKMRSVRFEEFFLI